MREKMNKRATRKAFTLVELVIVIAVIGILASVLVPTFASVINSAKDNASIQQATNARDEYIATNLISPEEAIGLLIETPRDLFIVNERCEVVRVNREDYDLNQYDKLPDIPTIKDVHIYAKKNTDIYTITFLVKDGTIDGNKKVYTKHKSDKIYSDYELTQESPIPKAIGNKKGYNSVFKGWQYGNAEVGVLVINEDGTFTNETTKSIFKDGKYNVESDINLYAKFERSVIEYTISYELDGGTNNENNPAKYTIEDEIILKDATKENYTFKGWYTDSEFNGEPITKIAKGTTNDVTLYAKFVEGTESTYSVEYYLQNIEDDDYTLKGEDTKSDIKGATGETVTADINTYEGFEQNTSSEKIAEASGEVKFDGSLVLKVYYNRIKYTITWQGANGVLKTEEYKYEAMPLYEGETPTKEQDNLKTYNFKAWNPTIEKVVRDTTYTAKFEETARKYDVIIYDEIIINFKNEEMSN